MQKVRTLSTLLVTALLMLTIMTPASADTNQGVSAASEWINFNWGRVPMSTAYYDARKAQTAIIDEAAGALPVETWNSYKTLWNDPAKAAQKEAMEDANPILYHFRQTELEVLNQVSNTTVTQGAVVWKMYNMGMIIKTPTKTFGIDLVQSDPQAFAAAMDFLVVSHVHDDHFYNVLANAVKAAGKTVYGPTNVGAATVKVPWGAYPTAWDFGAITEYNQGDVNLRFVISYQGVSYTNGVYGQKEPNLITKVTCGGTGNNYTIVHSGDSQVTEHANLAKNGAFIDLFMGHAGLSSIHWVTNKLVAGTNILGHENELGHDPRWDYNRIYTNVIEGANAQYFPKEKTIIGKWGERFDPYDNCPVIPPVTSAFSKIEAESYDSMAGVAIDTPEGFVKNIHNNDYIVFNEIDFGGGANIFEANLATPNTGGYFELRLGSVTGTLIGQTDPLVPTGADWSVYTNISCAVDPAPAKGKQKLYIVFLKPDSTSALCNIDYFKFRRKVEAEAFSTQSGTVTDAAGFIKNINDGDYLGFSNFDMAQGATKLIFTAATVNSGTIEVRSGSITGPLLGSAVITSTGGWATWAATECSLSPSAGVQNLYFVFKGAAGIGLLNLDSIEFVW